MENNEDLQGTLLWLLRPNPAPSRPPPARAQTVRESGVEEKIRVRMISLAMGLAQPQNT